MCCITAIANINHGFQSSVFSIQLDKIALFWIYLFRSLALMDIHSCPANLAWYCLSRLNDAASQMQAVCDHRNKIRSIFIGFPGSVHDARVFRRSPLATNLGILCQENVILGDSAYPCLHNLITPFKDNGRLSRQQNTIIMSVRY